MYQLEQCKTQCHLSCSLMGPSSPMRQLQVTYYPPPQAVPASYCRLQFTLSKACSMGKSHAKLFAVRHQTSEYWDTLWWWDPCQWSWSVSEQLYFNIVLTCFWGWPNRISRNKRMSCCDIQMKQYVSEIQETWSTRTNNYEVRMLDDGTCQLATKSSIQKTIDMSFAALCRAFLDLSTISVWNPW